MTAAFLWTVIRKRNPFNYCSFFTAEEPNSFPMSPKQQQFEGYGGNRSEWVAQHLAERPVESTKRNARQLCLVVASLVEFEQGQSCVPSNQPA